MAVKPKAGDPLTRLKEAYAFMTEHNLEAIDIEEPGRRLRLVRRKAAQVPVPVFAGGEAFRARQAPAGNEERPPSLPANVTEVKSAMMGIFYRAPSPSSPPFIKEGDAVSPGQILCIIEAMKVFNELKAELAGTVVKALVENGKSVKAGQTLFWIQRA